MPSATPLRAPCARCGHGWSFHGKQRRAPCKAIGCHAGRDRAPCPDYRPLPKPTASNPEFSDPVSA